MQSLKFVPVIVQGLGLLIAALYMLSLVVNALMRQVPTAWVIYVEKTYPRVAWAARAARKFGGDAIPALQAVYGVLAGRPYVPPPSPISAPPPSTQPVPRGNEGFVSRRMLVLIVGSVLVLVPASAALHGCAAAQHRAAAGTIVSIGIVVSNIHAAHQQIYTHATDELRGNVQGDAYDREVEPINTAFRKRSRAIASLSAALYAAAYVNDAVGPNATPAGRMAAARQVLASLHTALEELQSGDVLPALTLPPEVAQVETLLSTIAGGQ